MIQLEIELLRQEGGEPKNYKAPEITATLLMGRKVKYDNWKAITYAKSYCQKTDNSCGHYYDQSGKTDCAHFIAHCLNAGGVAIRPGDQSTTDCPMGLAMRNTDLVAGLRNLVTTSDNIQEMGITDAIVGDIGFLSNISRPSHAFMLCEGVNLGDPLKPAKVWSHTAARCCEDMHAEIRQWFATMFRITDAS